MRPGCPDRGAEQAGDRGCPGRTPAIARDRGPRTRRGRRAGQSCRPCNTLALSGQSSCPGLPGPPTSLAMPPVDFVARAVPPREPTAAPPLLVLLHGIGADEQDLLPL